MHPADSASLFQAAVTTAGMTVEKLGAAGALAQMADFYRRVRADNCILDEEGDTLLCEWGLHDEAPAPSFRLEFTRHFIEPGDEDEDGMSQLSLILHYAPIPGLRALKSGTLLCTSSDSVAEFEKSVLASPPYHAVSGLQPQKTTLQWFAL